MQDLVGILVPLFVLHAAVLVAAVVLMRRLLIGDTQAAVRRVQAVEAEVRKKEETIRRDIQEHEQVFAKQKLQAEEELQRHKAQTEKELARLRDQMLAEARKESDRILELAHKNEEKFRQKIAAEMEQKAVRSAAELFRLVFSERMTGELNRQFIEDLIEALAEMEAGAVAVEADEGDVRTSHPMDAQQKRRLEELLSSKFGHAVRLNETVDPQLLSGLVLKVGSMEIDGSLKNRFDEAVEAVAKGGA